jgi:hypothetical protein
MFHLKNDLTDAYKQVELMRSGKIQKQSMEDFLNEIKNNNNLMSIKFVNIIVPVYFLKLTK